MPRILECTLTQVKKTAGTIVYGNEDAGFRGIYVPKNLLPIPAPESIVLTLTTAAGTPVAKSADDEDPLS